MDRIAEGARFLVGHNIIEHDRPFLEQYNRHLEILKLPVVDTLRLNPLAYPKRPYHRLVKHYKDGGLVRRQANDPLLDSKLAIEAFSYQLQQFKASPPDLLTAWHWLTTVENGEGFEQVFSAVRGSPRPTAEEAAHAIRQRLQGQSCGAGIRQVVEDAPQQSWPLAFVLAWLSVSGTDSVIPPWVLTQFPETGNIVTTLRDVSCREAGCQWCAERHDPTRELKRWFNFPDFRPEPSDQHGTPLQKKIVQKALMGENLLAILPTGAGKSICYQVPALSRYDKIGAITVVISPLVALMADQVANLEKRGINTCATVNGLLSMPERRNALDRIRLGQVSILLISPEQLRSRSLRSALEQRQIGAWVLDEAHCLSKWGHDFRPDYRYIGRFILGQLGGGSPPPILCLTATAKPDVKQEIIDYFQEILGVKLDLEDGGAERTNLQFSVVKTTATLKLAQVADTLEDYLPSDLEGGAIIYCATRAHSEEVASFLTDKGVPTDHFHAGLTPERKKQVQDDFVVGRLRAIAATNAFGMGIDKPDVRLVVHADIPGSLENYLQEAGRAGRDNDAAHCVLLYTDEDIERQYGMTARSRLNRDEINAVLRALRNLDRKKRMNGEVVATTGEILFEDEENDFGRDTATDDTRVRTAVSWLEEASILSRHENEVNIFPASLQVRDMGEARRRLRNLDDRYKSQLLQIVRRLINAASDEGITTDELSGVTGLTGEEVRRALTTLAGLGLVTNDMVLTAYVHQGVQRPSRARFAQAAAMEEALIHLMQEQAPDQGKDESQDLHLRHASQFLKDQGHDHALPLLVQRSMRSIAAAGREEGQGEPNMRIRTRRHEIMQVTLLKDWHTIQTSAQTRRNAAWTVLQSLLANLPNGTRGADLLVETTLGHLTDSLKFGQLTNGTVDADRLLQQSLLWLHDQEVIRLNRGMSVFRSAMTIRMDGERSRFLASDFEPLRIHYDEQTLQIHIMSQYAEKGLQSVAEAVRLTLDYFSLPKQQFIDKWLSDKKQELSRQTTPESWRRIVESLRNRSQRAIVTDDRENANVLVLAGPGSGKTKVLVHRIAYLVRAKREDPRSILALAYNRHAAVEIRQRLHDLIGEDGAGVTVLTCHALAMRLAGSTFSGFAQRVGGDDQDSFDEILREATELLEGKRVAMGDADEQRDRLLAGFRWLLVDEYQDIKELEYNLIAALAGRTPTSSGQTMNLFAVGDDDQNIYSFSGSSTKYIRQFEDQYRAKPRFMTENYRSTQRIVAAANSVIEPALQRMKEDHPITVNRSRRRERAGGDWERIDPVTQGKVQILPAGKDAVTQAQLVVQELQRMATLDLQWDWNNCAVISRNWDSLDPVRALCQLAQIPVQFSREDFTATWQLRETQALLDWARDQGPLQRAGDLLQWLRQQPSGPWNDLLVEAVESYQFETNNQELPVSSFREWLAEWARDNRRRQHGLLLTSSHRAKGLEFDHVVVLDGNWDRVNPGDDPDAPRRLYYVSMTRAKRTLTLAKIGQSNQFVRELHDHPSVVTRPEQNYLSLAPPELKRKYLRLSLRDVQLSFAGRRRPSDPIHKAIARLAPGDPLRVRTDKSPWELATQDGITVGRLAHSFRPPAAVSEASAATLAIATWDKAKSDGEYQRGINCNQWEVVIPEIAISSSH
jgi:ATP-dependent DNA helicase RecQ